MWCLILTGRSSAAKHLKENPLKMQFLVLMKLFGKLSIHSTERRAILLSLKKISAPNIFRWLTCYSMCQLNWSGNPALKLSCSDFWKIQRHLNRVQSILALNWFKFEGDRKGFHDSTLCFTLLGSAFHARQTLTWSRIWPASNFMMSDQFALLRCFWKQEPCTYQPTLNTQVMIYQQRIAHK